MVVGLTFAPDGRGLDVIAIYRGSDQRKSKADDAILTLALTDCLSIDRDNEA